MKNENEKLIREGNAALENGYRRSADRIILFPSVLKALEEASILIDLVNTHRIETEGVRHQLDQCVKRMQALTYQMQNESNDFAAGESTKRKITGVMQEIREHLETIRRNEV
jgi:hypothetical protein